MTNAATINIKVQRTITIVAIVLFVLKLLAYYTTKSVAILTDALESIVNIVAALIGLYSLKISAQPRDLDHPYGHGKVEFISSAIEGVLIIVAGITIIYSAVQNLIVPKAIAKIDFGLIIISVTALVNYIMGVWCINVGKKNTSPALISSGTHLISDTYTTIGVIVGLILIYITNIIWIDSVVALAVAVLIMHAGYKILKTSIEGIMDKADMQLLKDVIAKLERNRSENWIDLHNLRILKYGNVLHLDAHLTVPWFFNVNEAHVEVNKVDALIKNSYGDTVELFIHTDGCLPFSCSICTKANCTERKQPLTNTEIWSTENVLANTKHGSNQK